MSAAQVIADYVAAWNCPDVAARAALLDASWAPGAGYTDPTVDLHGVAALDAHIAR